MPSSYSTNLKIELMATGENSGTWGTNTNTNLGTAMEQAIIGYGNPDYTSDANLTITITNSSAAQAARALVLNVTSVFGSLTATRELIVPTIQKQYIVQNNTTGGQSITVKTSAGTGITVPTGRKAHLYVDGTNVVQMFDFVDINGGTIDGATVGASSASTGSFTTLSATGAITLNTTTNNQSYTTTGAGIITISSGTAGSINNMTIGATTAATGAFTTLSASSTATLNTLVSSGATLTGGTINGMTIGAIISAAGTFNTIRVGAAVSDELLTINGSSAGFVARILTTLATNPNGLYVNSTNAIGTGTAFRVDSAGSALLTLNSTGLQVASTLSGGTSGTGYSFSGSAPAGSLALDSSGNLGVGVTPSTSNTAGASFVPGTSTVASMTGSNGSGQLLLGNNGGGSNLAANDSCGMIAFKGRFNSTFGGGNDIASIIGTYTGNGTTRSGAIRFLTLDSGTEAERARIDSSGNLGIGTTSPQRLLQVGSANGEIRIGGAAGLEITHDNSGSTTGEIKQLYAATSASAQLKITSGFTTFLTGTSGTERARIDASGNLVVGGTSARGRIGSYVSDATTTFSSLGYGMLGLQNSSSTNNNYSWMTFIESNGNYAAAIGSLNEVHSSSSSSVVGSLLFATKQTGVGGFPVERARIDSSGNLLVGTTSQIGNNAIVNAVKSAGSAYYGKVTTSNYPVINCWNAISSGDNNFASFAVDTGYVEKGTITYNRSAGLVAYNTTSDYRAKDIIGPVTGSGALIDSTPVYMGKMKDATQERPMFIAHEVPAYAHTGEKDAVDKDGNPVYQQMDASALIPVMWAELQSLRARVAQLESKP